MKKILRKYKWLFLVAIVITLSVPDVASALVTTHHAADIILQNESFVAEGRIGDLGGAATFELDIGATTSAPAQTANFIWVNGYSHSFNLTYNNIINIVSFTVGDVTLTYSPAQVSTDIYIRTRAVNSNTSIVLNNLVLDGVPVNDTSIAANPGNGIEILQISGGTLSDGFTLTGKSKMTWTGSPPTQSRLAYQITIADGSADMEINKTVSSGPVIVGQNLTYTINATNNGPGTANGVTITDILPAGVTLISAVQTHGTCSGTTTVICDIASLANGETATATVVVTPIAAGTIINQADVSANETDPNTANNTVYVSTTVNASADISIAKSDSPDPVTVGDSLLYTINVTNNGPSPANNVTVTDTLHPNVNYDSATPSQGSCNGTTTVICNLGTLANGASETLLIVVIPTVAGTIDNTAIVAADEDDPDGSNNTSLTEDTTVIAAPGVDADLSITKIDFDYSNNTDYDPVAVPGDPLVYTITVTNNGPSTATGVTVTDTLPPQVSYTDGDAVPSQGSCSGTSPIICNIGTLANGDSATITVTVTSPVIAGMISNTASVTGNEADPNMVNNSAAETTNVGDLSRLLAVSTRAYVGTGTDAEVVGFIIGGTLPKTVLVRGFGPSMSATISGTLADPFLEIFSFAAGVYIAQNNNWGDQGNPLTSLCTTSGYVCGNAAEISATSLDPCQQSGNATGCTYEAALLITLPPGAYSGRLSGINNGTGIGRIGVWDLDSTTLPKLDGLSTRAYVGMGTDALVGGFIIGGGGGNKTLLIRAFGPSMSATISGTLQNPYLEVYSFAAGAYIARNDNWGNQTTDTLCSSSGFVCGSAAEISATGLDPCQQSGNAAGCTDESSLLITLPPGSYSAKISGVDNGTGVGRIGISDISQ